MDFGLEFIWSLTPQTGRREFDPPPNGALGVAFGVLAAFWSVAKAILGHCEGAARVKPGRAYLRARSSPWDAQADAIGWHTRCLLYEETCATARQPSQPALPRLPTKSS